MGGRRWEGDERGVGVADGAAHAPEARALLAALAEPGWVAEDPDAHLLPGLRAACAAPGSPWALLVARPKPDGAFLVELAWDRPGGGLRELRADAFALVGRVAEATTHVRQVVADGAVEYRVATGMLDGDGPFAGHGHLLVLRVRGPRIPGLAAGARTRPAL